jgi:hypothetical protein
VQNLKDAAVVLAFLLLVVSVKVTPLDPAGEMIPSAVASTGAEGGPALAGLVGGPSAPEPGLQTPAAKAEQAPQRRQILVDTETSGCDASFVHVNTVELGTTGKRIILRIDTHDGQAHIERVESAAPAEPAPQVEVLEACKIG